MYNDAVLSVPRQSSSWIDLTRGRAGALCLQRYRTTCPELSDLVRCSVCGQSVRSRSRRWRAVPTSDVKKGSPCSITERWVPELISVLGIQPAGNVSHKPGGRLPLLPARPAVTPATLKRAATNLAAWRTETQWVWTICLRLVMLNETKSPSPRPVSWDRRWDRYFRLETDRGRNFGLQIEVETKIPVMLGLGLGLAFGGLGLPWPWMLRSWPCGLSPCFGLD